MANELVIRGGRVIDPAAGRDEIADVLLRDGRVAEVGAGLSAGETFDARGMWVVPGLIDVHVHLRDPGETHKESIATGAEAAAAGGYTAILAMPNTQPPLDSPHLVRQVLDAGRQAGFAEVLVAACLTEGRQGARPADLHALAKAGAIAFTDDGSEVADARVLRACMKEAACLRLPVLCHAEMPDLAEGGVMNEGKLAARLGLPGRPALAEELAVARDLAIAADAGCMVHFQHISTARALALVAAAKRDSALVSCEATPHHLLLAEEACAGYDANAKVNPPLRSHADRKALVTALAGTVDMIATDHAPHSVDDKGIEFDRAAAGMLGLETALGLVLTDLVRKGKLSPSRMVELMSARPAKLLGAAGAGTLSPGSRADIALIDPEYKWAVEPDAFRSKSRNTPFAGRSLTGRAVATFVAGRRVFSL